MERKILLNSGPATTRDTVKNAQIVPDICPREKEFVKLMKEIREDLVKIVHGNSEEYTSVLFCGSGTICMDICLNSLLPADKKILVVNNGAYSARAAEICDYYRLPYINLKFPVDALPDLKEIENILADDPDIALVYATHNETGTGILNPVREIGALAHRYDACFVVDTTSTYAMRPIDIKEENIDFCMASAQKGLMAMTGVSYVVGNRKMIEESRHFPKRSYYCNLYMQYEYFEKHGEMHFTPPVQTLYALRQALKEYFEEGEEAKWNRHKRVFEAIHGELQKLGFRDVIKREWQAGLVAAIKYPEDENWDFEKIHDYCYEKGFTIYPGKIGDAKTFRLCALGAIDEEDIYEFFQVFQKGLQEMKIKIPVVYHEVADEKK